MSVMDQPGEENAGRAPGLPPTSATSAAGPHASPPRPGDQTGGAGSWAPGGAPGAGHPMDSGPTLEWERTYAMWTHMGCLIAGLIAAGSAGIGFWAPPVVALAMWLTKRDRSAFIDDHGRECLNFQITMIIYGVVALVSGFITCSVGWFVLFPLIFVLSIVGTIMGAIAANKGRLFRYPMCIRFVS